MSKALLDDTVLKLIDTKLVLNGSVTSKDVYRHLGLVRQKVSKVFQDYLAANPDSMVYVPAKRKFLELRPSKYSFFSLMAKIVVKES
jgi:hypothetical protein